MAANVGQASRLSGAGETPALQRFDLLAIWAQEWQANLLHTTLARFGGRRRREEANSLAD